MRYGFVSLLVLLEGASLGLTCEIFPPIDREQDCTCRHLDAMQVYRSLPPVVRGAPGIFEERREQFECEVERLVDKIDPPRFFPLVGPARLHHRHYKCTVSYVQTTQATFFYFPVQLVVQRRRIETIYMDRDHLHVVQPRK